MLSRVSNLGGTFPKIFVLKLVDFFTKATCIPAAANSSPKLKEGAALVTAAFSCALQAEKHRCEDGGGTCHIERDGYYITNVLFLIVGALLFWAYIERKALALQALPLRAWRVHNEGSYTRVNGGT